MRVTGGIYEGKVILAFALAIVVFLYGSGAQAQTPADDQYGSPTEIGIPGAVAGQEMGVADSSGSVDGSAADNPSYSTGTPASPVGTKSSDGPGGVLATALPATGGSLLSLTGLVAIALVGTGVLLSWRKSVRG